jgi:hypothetical protein
MQTQILPLSDDLVIKYLNNKKEKLVINYTETRKKMDAKSIISYVSNLNVEAEVFDFDEEFIVEFITSEYQFKSTFMCEIIGVLIQMHQGLMFEENDIMHELGLTNVIKTTYKNNIELIEQIDLFYKQIPAWCFLHSMHGEVPEFVNHYINAYEPEMKNCDTKIFFNINVIMSAFQNIGLVFLPFADETYSLSNSIFLYDIMENTKFRGGKTFETVMSENGVTAAFFKNIETIYDSIKEVQ